MPSNSSQQIDYRHVFPPNARAVRRLIRPPCVGSILVVFVVGVRTVTSLYGGVGYLALYAGRGGSNRDVQIAQRVAGLPRRGTVEERIICKFICTTEGSSGMTESRTILAVCTANICRSPSTVFLLSQRLPPAISETSSWASAGVRARQGASICPDISYRLEERYGWHSFAEAHRSERLTPELIEDATLILTASVRERGQVAQLQPSARTRTFTLLEAAALAEQAADRGPALSGRSVEEIGQLLHAQRGLLQPTRRRWAFRRNHPFDVPDAHDGSAHHGLVLRLLSDGTERLGAALA